MKDRDDGQPSRAEISEALAAILASNLFRSSGRHSEILAFLVETSLVGGEITEKLLIQRFFPHHEKKSEDDPEPNIARVTMSGFGKELAIIIQLSGRGIT